MPNASTHPTKPILGLLGGIASGKSTAARAFADQGCAIIDADKLAHAALDDPTIRDTLVAWWGDQVLDASANTTTTTTTNNSNNTVNNNTPINRAAIGRIVFEDSQSGREALAKLESIVHPWVAAARKKRLDQYRADPAVVAIVEDCPLLLERNLHGDCTALVFVDAPDSQRLCRVTENRGWTAAELAKREKRQWPLDIKRQRADYVLVNDVATGEAPRQALSSQVRGVLQSVCMT